MGNEFVILVDEKDQQLGLMEKMKAHQEAVLHRAFSVFLFNNEGLLLLQQRALSKYHSPGLWTNTCCSHPRDGETVLSAAERRLHEEMGMTANLNETFWFIYKADVGHGLTENELDHVLIGFSDELPLINPDEVHDWKYAGMDQIAKDILQHPDLYTVWFKIIFNRVHEYLNNQQ